MGNGHVFVLRENTVLIVDIDTSQPVWDRCFTVAPLVLVGTREEGGELDLAPKHMVAPMGWQNYFGFVCSPTHGTYVNIARTGVFTFSYPRPSQVLYTSLGVLRHYVAGRHADTTPIFG